MDRVLLLICKMSESGEEDLIPRLYENKDFLYEMYQKIKSNI